MVKRLLGKRYAMPRVKRSVHARKKRRKVLEQAKGYWGLKSTNYTYAKEQVEHSLVYAYRDRKAQEARRSGGSGSSASTRARARTGSRTTSSSRVCKAADVELDRKVLADLAVSDPARVRQARRAGEGRARR